MDEESNLTNIILDIEMPCITMTFNNQQNGEKEAIYMKYLDPSEFNIFVQSKFKDW